MSAAAPGATFARVRHRVTLRISGSLDAEALERAVGEIVRRHEALRTVMVGAGGVPAQRVFPFAGVRLPARPDGDAAGGRRRGGAARVGEPSRRVRSA